MGLRDISNIKIEYTTFSDEVVNNFYVPCLKESIEYKRAVGFFSSSILLQISKGLGIFAKNGGKIKLLISPRLDENDYKAIEEGYEIKKYVENKLIDAYDENIDFDQKEDRFALLSYLIAKDILDIRVVVLNKHNDKAMYHEKLGIMKDDEDNIVSFSGSGNESYNAFNLNYECFDVYRSWNSKDDADRCAIKDFRFDSLWSGFEKGVVTIPFPEIIKNKILSHDYKNVDFVKLDEDLRKLYVEKQVKGSVPNVGLLDCLYDYQLKAIDNWVNNGYQGIFDMATGTGKTFTGCGAITQLFEDKKRLFVIICCPYIHLVDQWCEEVQNFNIVPIKCYGSINYEKKVKREVQKFKHKRTNFVCLITTNITFQKKLQKYVFDNLDDTLLVVDEAHNFGSKNLSSCMKVNYPYRLALSATLDRHGDEAGTARLYKFFGEKSITYSLEQAIQEGKLTRYKYYPVLVYLSESELEEYYTLTDKIKKYFLNDDDELPDGLKMLLIQRSRIVAGANDKIRALKNQIEPYKRRSNLLIYCGAVKYGDLNYENDEEDIRQIDKVSDILINDLNMIAARFTSQEDSIQRQQIINAYKNEEIQALVAIKCLDEGMNIPAIKTAFILASSTNPKEYIQRRGRVLRKFPGKKYAEIFDFVTLPRTLDSANLAPPDKRKTDKNMVERELLRVMDFARLSNNPSYCNKIVETIKYAYGIDTINEEDIWEYE